MFVGRKKELDALKSRYTTEKNLVYCMEEDELGNHPY